MAIFLSAQESYRKALADAESASCVPAANRCRVGFVCAPTEGAVCFHRRCVVKLKGVALPID